MATVQERAVEIMKHFVDTGVAYSMGKGHSQSEWTDYFTLSDGTTARGPRVTDCSGGVICAYENADPGCTGGAGDTGDMKTCFLSTGKWEWHPAGDGYIAKPGDVYLYSKYNHSEGGHTAMCYTAVPDMMVDVFPNYARITEYYNYGSGWDGKLVYIGNGGGTSTGGTIEVDGYWGKATTAALQRHYGCSYVDGEVWHQYAPNVNANSALTSGWICDSTLTGSPVIRALQEDLGTSVDGVFGTNDIKALQRRCGTYVDGVLTGPSPCVKEMQRRLNAGTW